MSKHAVLRQSRRAAVARQQLIFMGVTVALAVAVVGYIIYLSSNPFAGKVVANASGKSFGTANAPVVIREFSDFQ